MKFIKYTKIWFTISILVIVASIGAMINNHYKLGTSLVYGIDFTGGSVLEIHFQNNLKPDPNAIYAAFEAADPDSIEQITETGEGNHIIQSKDMTEEQLQAVSASITQKVGAFDLIQFNTIGPKIGETLKQKAILALIIALVAIVFYIAFAFRKVPKKISPWKFGFSAILGLVHNVIITVGVFALLRYEVNSFFITALLTIIGFSVHDTIVVFDRIRENLKKQGRDDTFGDITDVALNQTMARSINTSISTLLPLITLYIWGAQAIQHFVFALIVGIVVGTYSSIFIASPFLTLWQERSRIRE